MRKNVFHIFCMNAISSALSSWVLLSISCLELLLSSLLISLHLRLASVVSEHRLQRTLCRFLESSLMLSGASASCLASLNCSPPPALNLIAMLCLGSSYLPCGQESASLQEA